MQLGNLPSPGHTLLRLASRKSFAFSLRFVEGNGRQVDITGCTVTLVVGQTDRSDDDELLIAATADLTLPHRGFAMFNLQAVELDLPDGEYPFAVVLRSPSGYSSLVMQGTLDLQPNTEFASVNHLYESENTPVSVEVEMRGTNVVEVRLGPVLPPGMNYLTDEERTLLQTALIPPGGKIGQALVKASGADRDVKWAATGGGGTGLYPEGVTAGLVPMADGQDSWEWSEIPSSQAVRIPLTDLNDLTATGAYAFDSYFEGMLENNFPLATNAALVEVVATADASTVYQRYVQRVGGRVFHRSKHYPSTQWSQWFELARTGHTHAALDIDSGVLAAARVPKVTGLRGITYGTGNPPANAAQGDLYVKYVP